MYSTKIYLWIVCNVVSTLSEYDNRFEVTASYNSHYYAYYFNGTAITWDNANQVCIADMGYLVRIENDVESEFLVDYVRRILEHVNATTDIVWLGQIIWSTDNNYAWRDGTSLADELITTFELPQPGDPNRVYNMAMNYNTELLRPKTSGTGAFVCEFDNLCQADSSINPCKNGASCVQTPSQPEVTCNCDDTGYDGDTCENDVDECVSNPCLNQGKCTQGVDTFTCDCEEPYTGVMCDIYNPPCDSCRIYSNQCRLDPCINGDCVDVTETQSYSCHCQDTYQGLRCTDDVNECEIPNFCNSGECRNRAPGFSCTCDAGYSGTRCESDIDECAHDTILCAARSECMNTFGSYRCLCPSAGITGKMCSDDLDECRFLDACSGNGVCRNLPSAGFSCECTIEFSGDRCSLVGTGAAAASTASVFDIAPILTASAFGIIVLLAYFGILALYRYKKGKKRFQTFVKRTVELVDADSNAYSLTSESSGSGTSGSATTQESMQAWLNRLNTAPPTGTVIPKNAPPRKSAASSSDETDYSQLPSRAASVASREDDFSKAAPSSPAKGAEPERTKPTSSRSKMAEISANPNGNNNSKFLSEFPKHGFKQPTYDTTLAAPKKSSNARQPDANDFEPIFFFKLKEESQK